MILHVLWVLLLWIGFVAKLIQQGIPTFFMFFTNWAWVFYVVFYSITLSPRIRKQSHIIVVWFIHGTAWVVYIFISLILFYNPNILLENKDLPLGFVFNLDRFFHIFPVFAILIYLIVYYRTEIIRTRITLLEFIISVWSPVIPLFLFSLLFDIRVIYGIFHLNIVTGTILALFILTIFNGYGIRLIGVI